MLLEEKSEKNKREKRDARQKLVMYCKLQAKFGS